MKPRANPGFGARGRASVRWRWRRPGTSMRRPRWPPCRRDTSLASAGGGSLMKLLLICQMTNAITTKAMIELMNAPQRMSTSGTGLPAASVVRVLQLDHQGAEVDPTEENPDGRHDDVVDERVDDRPERRADDHADRQRESVGLEQELAELDRPSGPSRLRRLPRNQWLTTLSSGSPARSSQRSSSRSGSGGSSSGGRRRPPGTWSRGWPRCAGPARRTNRRRRPRADRRIRADAVDPHQVGVVDPLEDQPLRDPGGLGQAIAPAGRPAAFEEGVGRGDAGGRQLFGKGGARCPRRPRSSCFESSGCRDLDRADDTHSRPADPKTTPPERPWTQAFRDEMTSGYGLAEPALILGSPMLDGELFNDARVQVALSMMNRHRPDRRRDRQPARRRPLQLLAGELSKAGVPVFVADIKGDADRNREPRRRHEPPGHRAGGVDGLDVPARRSPGRVPVPVRHARGPGPATVHSFGPLLLGKVLDLKRDADIDPVADLQVLRRQRPAPARPEGPRGDAEVPRVRRGQADPRRLRRDVAGVGPGCSCARSSSSSRKVPTRSSASPSSTSATSSGRPSDGFGIVSVLELRDVMDKPSLFSTFMLWMLAQLYETLPRGRRPAKPKLCFFFDEAHLLFDGASDALLAQIERTARLIRIQGGRGVFRDPGADRRPVLGPGPARQPGPARPSGHSRPTTPMRSARPRGHSRRRPTTTSRRRSRRWGPGRR